MNKIAVSSSGSISEGLGAPPPLKLAGSKSGRLGNFEPAFLKQHIGGAVYLTPLQVIRIKHKL